MFDAADPTLNAPLSSVFTSLLSHNDVCRVYDPKSDDEMVIHFPIGMSNVGRSSRRCRSMCDPKACPTACSVIVDAVGLRPTERRLSPFFRVKKTENAVITLLAVWPSHTSKPSPLHNHVLAVRCKMSIDTFMPIDDLRIMRVYAGMQLPYSTPAAPIEREIDRLGMTLVPCLGALAVALLLTGTARHKVTRCTIYPT